MRKILEKLVFSLFLVFFLFCLALPILRAVKISFKGTLASLSITPANTTVGQSNDYFVVFTPSADVTGQVVNTSNGIEINFSTYGFDLSDAYLINYYGFPPGGGSLTIASISSSQYIRFKGVGTLTYGTGSHTLSVGDLKNCTVSGPKQITVYLKTAALPTDSGTTTVTYNFDSVSDFSLSASAVTLSAASSTEVTIKAVDQYSNVNTGHSGTAVITQSGATGSNIAYSGTGVTDTGTGTATLSTTWSSGQKVVSISNSSTGIVTFTATDTTNSSINGSIAINWNQAGAVTHFTIEALTSANPEAGSEVSLSVYARDANEITNTSYNGNNGNVNITQSGGTANKISYGGSATDLGSGSAYISSSKWSSGTADVSIKDTKAEGPVTFTFTQANNTSITGSTPVTWKKGTVSYFTVSPNDPSPAPGQSVTLTVKAYDSEDSQITDYSGSGELTAVQAGTSTNLSQVRWGGTGVIVNDQPGGKGTYNSNAWSSGEAKFTLVNYLSGQQTVAIVTSTSESDKKGRSTEVSWEPAPTGTLNLNTSTRDIPPNNSSVAALTSDDIYDTVGNRIPNSSVFTVTTNLGTITDSDINSFLPETQLATSDGKITVHLKSGTPGIAQIQVKSLSVTPGAAGESSTYAVAASGDTRIMVSPLRVNSVSSTTSQVNRGDQNIPLEIEVENISSSSATVAYLKPCFYKEITSGYDVTGEYDITPDSTNPTSVGAGSKAKFKFTAAATRLKTNGAILLDAALQLSGSTIKYCRWNERNNTVWHAYAKTTDTWTAAGGEEQTTDIPNYIYQIRSTHAGSASFFLNGDYLPANSGIEITFYDSGYRIYPTITEVKLNDGTLALNVGYFYNTETGVLTIPDVGDEDGTIRLKVKDISGRDLPETTLTFKINKSLAQSNFLCYPNPSRAGQSVKIGFQLSSAATVKFFIFNSSAELVWSTSLDGVAGYNELSWNGIDVRGNVVGGGIYTLRLLARDDEGRQVVGRAKLGIL